MPAAALGIGVVRVGSLIAGVRSVGVAPIAAMAACARANRAIGLHRDGLFNIWIG
jgi:hypothetical protein